MVAAKTHVFDERMPSTAEIENANQLRQILASRLKDDQPTRLTLALKGDEKAEIVLTPALAHSFMELLRHVGSGHAVTIVPTSEQLTTQRAADILNVSRPHLIKLLETGEMPYSLVGRHRRIRARDVFDYRRRRNDDRAESLSRLAEMDADVI